MQKLKIIVTAILFLAGYTSVWAQTTPDAFYLAPIVAQSIPVTQTKITCIIFPVNIQPAGKGTRDIKAQKVKGTDNVLMVQAARPNFAPTNLTVIGLNGRLYSLVLRYESEPAAYNYRVIEDSVVGYTLAPEQTYHPVLLSGLPVDESTLSADADTIAGKRSFLHCSTGSERMHLVLKSLYVKDQLLWFAIKLKNHSLLDYRAGFVHFSIQDIKRAKRTAIQERVLPPVYSSSEKIIPGNGSRLLVFAFRPFTIPRHKKLVLQMSEPDGGRLLTLPVGYKTVLKARALE